MTIPAIGAGQSCEKDLLLDKIYVSLLPCHIYIFTNHIYSFICGSGHTWPWHTHVEVRIQQPVWVGSLLQCRFWESHSGPLAFIASAFSHLLAHPCPALSRITVKHLRSLFCLIEMSFPILPWSTFLNHFAFLNKLYFHTEFFSPCFTKYNPRPRQHQLFLL